MDKSGNDQKLENPLSKKCDAILCLTPHRLNISIKPFGFRFLAILNSILVILNFHIGKMMFYNQIRHFLSNKFQKQFREDSEKSLLLHF